MLPTSCVERSYFSFSGAFMAVSLFPAGNRDVPDSFRELGVVGGHQLRHRPPQRLKFLFARAFCHRHLPGRIEVEARLGADVARLMDALQPEAALALLPGEERLSREERLRV